MLAPTLTNQAAQPVAQAPERVRPIALDCVLLIASLTAAAAFFFQGGLEALVGAAIGAMTGAYSAPWKNDRLPAAISGAFAGLFAGALGAAFFHSLLFAFF